jgi:streptogramin lyase
VGLDPVDAVSAVGVDADAVARDLRHVMAKTAKCNSRERRWREATAWQPLRQLWQDWPLGQALSREEEGRCARCAGRGG